MTLPTWWGRELPCGCVRGVKLCAEAVSLWDDVADAHKKLAAAFHERVNIRDARLPEVDAYNAANNRFLAHVEIGLEPAVQRPML